MKKFGFKVPLVCALSKAKGMIKFMNNIKMVVGDLDDTILDSKKQISSEMKRMRNQLRQHGILFVIATARSVASASQYIAELEPDYIISCDGGLISSMRENLFVNSMTEKQFSRLYSSIRDSDEIGKISIVSITNDYSNYKGKSFPEKFEVGIIKVICEVFTENMRKVLQKENQDLLMSYYDGQAWVRFSNRRATKYCALCQLCQFIGDLSIDQVLAFGDDCNDVEILANCGIGVAVSNAIASAKEVSDYITTDNNSDGVAFFIKKYFEYK